MNIYARITQLILKKLQKGRVPWHQPWTAATWPENLFTGHRYRGINVFILTNAGYALPYWLTFRQAKKLGGRVKKKERGTPIVYWKLLEKVDDEGEKYYMPLLRFYTVFNVRQCEGIETPQPEVINEEWQPLEECERIIDHMPHKPTIAVGASAAYYDFRRDRINLPSGTFFKNTPEYYSTLFHELIHSTGHSSRLNRKTVIQATRFGSTNYSKEELIAEMGAAFLCAHTGIENTTINNSAAYIAGWLERLQNDSRLVIHAAAQAYRAYAWILNLPSDMPAVSAESTADIPEAVTK